MNTKNGIGKELEDSSVAGLPAVVNATIEAANNLSTCVYQTNRRKSLSLPPRTVFLPSFDADAGEGGRINDCFAYGTPVAMKVIHLPVLFGYVSHYVFFFSRSASFEARNRFGASRHARRAQRTRKL